MKAYLYFEWSSGNECMLLYLDLQKQRLESEGRLEPTFTTTKQKILACTGLVADWQRAQQSQPLTGGVTQQLMPYKPTKLSFNGCMIRY